MAQPQHPYTEALIGSIATAGRVRRRPAGAAWSPAARCPARAARRPAATSTRGARRSFDAVPDRVAAALPAPRRSAVRLPPAGRGRGGNRWLSTRSDGLAYGLLVVFFVMVLVFLALHAVPGDAVRLQLADAPGSPRSRSPSAPPRSGWTNRWARSCCGSSAVSSRRPRTVLSGRRSVAGLIAERLPITLQLGPDGAGDRRRARAAMGLISAVRANSLVDQTLRVVSVSGLSIPNFWLGPAAGDLPGDLLRMVAAAGLQGTDRDFGQQPGPDDPAGVRAGRRRPWPAPPGCCARRCWR